VSLEQKVNKRPRFRFQFSLTLVLIGLTVACGAMAWAHSTQRFKRAAYAMEKLQVTVSYYAASNCREKPQLYTIPEWKAKWFGEDYCFRMNRLDIGYRSVASSPRFWKELAKHRRAMPEVEVVSLSLVKVDDEVMDVLSRLPLLELYFYQCELEDGVLEKLDRFPKLQTVLFLDIDQNLDYRKLAKSKQLVQIGLEDCEIDLETCEFLRAELPSAYVFAF